MFGSSYSAAGGADALEEILKQKFIEMVQRKKLAQDDRSLDMQGSRDATAAKLGFGNLDVSRGNLDMRRKEYDTATAPQPEKPVIVGGRLVVPSTGKVVYEPPAAPDAPQRPVSVAPGGRLVDPTTGRVLFAAPERAPAGQAAATTAKTEAKQAEANEVQQTLDLIQRIREDKARPIATGPVEGRGVGRIRDNSGYERVKALHDQLVGRLQLAQAGKLKGQGQISDREREMLMKAATALTRTLADPDYVTELDNIEGVLRGRHAMPAAGAPPSDAAKRAAELLKKYGG